MRTSRLCLRVQTRRLRTLRLPPRIGVVTSRIEPRWLALGTTAFLVGLTCGVLAEHLALG